MMVAATADHCCYMVLKDINDGLNDDDEDDDDDDDDDDGDEDQDEDQVGVGELKSVEKVGCG